MRTLQTRGPTLVLGTSILAPYTALHLMESPSHLSSFRLMLFLFASIGPRFSAGRATAPRRSPPRRLHMRPSWAIQPTWRPCAVRWRRARRCQAPSRQTRSEYSESWNARLSATLRRIQRWALFGILTPEFSTSAISFHHQTLETRRIEDWFDDCDLGI